MGTLNKGILGGFSGKVGTVIGSKWKNIEYMRSRSNGRTSAPSILQEIQQAKFALAARFLGSLNGLFDISFRDNSGKMTGSNIALSYTLKNAVSGTYPDLAIDFASVLVAQGKLHNAFSPEAASATAGRISFRWKDNSGLGKTKASDKAVVVAYCVELNLGVYNTAAASRNEEQAELDMSAFSGKTVQTWLAFIAENGKLIASSIYTGELIIA